MGGGCEKMKPQQYKHYSNIIPIMTTINNVFLTKQTSSNTYEIINPKYNMSKLRFIENTQLQIYTHNDLHMHIDKNNNKKYFRYINKPHHIQDNIIIQQLSPIIIQSNQFPLLKTYDNQINRQINTYYDKKINLNINIINDTNTKNEITTYIQIIGNYPPETILKFTQTYL
jgi:hypothetical protein